MVNDELTELIPPHRSFSQRKTFKECAHQYYLSKIRRVPEEPAVFLAAGSALHTLIEGMNHAFFEAGMQHD